MSRIHVVAQGECLSSIAHAYGFKSYQTIYQHPDNAAFRRRRPDPAVIAPGDEIHIPDRPPPKVYSFTTGKTHQIRLDRPLTTLRLRLQDPTGAPLKDASYVLRFGGKQRQGTTSAEGLLEQRIPATLMEAVLEVPSLELKMKLRLGTLDPLDTITGLQTRLNNLGFGAGTVDGRWGPQTQQAVRRFQETRELMVTGELNAETREALLHAYGC